MKLYIISWKESPMHHFYFAESEQEAIEMYGFYDAEIHYIEVHEVVKGEIGYYGI